MHQKRPVYMQGTNGRETPFLEKRRTYIKRDLHTLKETNGHEKRPKNKNRRVHKFCAERGLPTRKETWRNGERDRERGKGRGREREGKERKIEREREREREREGGERERGERERDRERKRERRRERERKGSERGGKRG